jgi:hypothetical protein
MAVRRHLVVLAVVAVLVVLAGACSSGESVTPISAGRTTSTTSTTTPGEATTAAILAGYRAEDAALYEAADHFPVNLTDPRLAATMTGPELVAVRSRLLEARFQSQYAVGTAELDPVVTGIDGTTATVSDCLFDHSRIVNGRTGKTVSGPDTERTLEHATLQLVDGVWKVATNQEVSMGCQPGNV